LDSAFSTSSTTNIGFATRWRSLVASTRLGRVPSLPYPPP
jgi:hypothetical protein